MLHSGRLQPALPTNLLGPLVSYEEKKMFYEYCPCFFASNLIIAAALAKREKDINQKEKMVTTEKGSAPFSRKTFARKTLGRQSSYNQMA